MSRSCASEVLRLKSFTRRRFQAGARSSAATSAANSPTSPMRISGAGDAVVRGGLEAERQHLGVGGGLVGAAERLDAGLQEFGRQHRRGRGTPGRDSRSPAASRPLARRGSRSDTGMVRSGRRHSSRPSRVGGEVHALADVLARQVEERLGRLQDRRRDAAIAGALIGGDERLGPCVGLRCLCSRSSWSHGRPAAAFARAGRAFSTAGLRFRRQPPRALNGGRPRPIEG